MPRSDPPYSPTLASNKVKNIIIKVSFSDRYHDSPYRLTNHKSYYDKSNERIPRFIFRVALESTKNNHPVVLYTGQGNTCTSFTSCFYALRNLCVSSFPRSGRWKQAKREARRDIREGSPRLNTNPRNNRPITNSRTTMKNQRNTRRFVTARSANVFICDTLYIVVAVGIHYASRYSRYKVLSSVRIYRWMKFQASCDPRPS